MKLIRLLIILLGCSSLVSAPLDSERLLYYAENEDIERLEELMISFAHSSPQEIRFFFEDLISLMQNRYHIDINLNDVKSEILNLAQACNTQVALEMHNFFETIYKESTDFDSSFMQFCSNKKSKKQVEEKSSIEAPIGIVVGGVEVLAGTLLWLTPFRTVGVGMIVDGVRRMLNEVETQAKENQTA